MTLCLVMREYQERRGSSALPIYGFTTELATLEPPPPEMKHLLGAMAGNQPAMECVLC